MTEDVFDISNVKFSNEIEKEKMGDVYVFGQLSSVKRLA